MDCEDECMDMEEDSRVSPELETSTLFGKLLKTLDDELELSHLQDVVYLIEDKVGTALKSVVDIQMHETPSSILKKMTNALTEQETLAVLRHALNVMNLYIEDGSKRCSDVIAEYERQLAKLKTEHHVFRTERFVGRKKQLIEAMDALRGTDCLGVWVSGMGGMGKTTLASEVCYRLVTNNRMDICRIDMRNRSTLRSLVTGLLSAKGNKMREETNLTEQAIDCLGTVSQDTVIFLDNLDDVHAKDNEKFYQFLADIKDWLKNNQAGCKIKLLMTAREDGLKDKCLGLQMKSILLTRLNEKDSKKLLRWLCRKQKAVITDACYNVLDACDGCPLAIHKVSDLLRKGENANQITMSIRQSGVPGMSGVIRSSFQHMKETAQRSLIQLSVFKSASFTQKAAASVLFQGSVNKNLLETSKVLLNLQLRTFLEEKEKYDSNIMTSTRYALHPVVFHFLKEIRKEEKQKYRAEYLSAQKRFVTHYIKEIDDLGPNLEADYSKSYMHLDADKVHIETMFSLVAEIEDAFKEEKLSRSLTSISKILFNPDQKCNVFRDIAKHQKPRTNELLYWSIQEADSYLEFHKYEQTEEQLQKVDKEMAFMTDVSHLVKGEFYLVTCRLHKLKKEFDKALDSSKKSLTAYRQCKPASVYFGHCARAANAIGTVYYSMHQNDQNRSFALKYPGTDFLDEAERNHKQALRILRENLNSDLYPDIPLYLVNIGTILHEKGRRKFKGADDSDSYLEDALKKYEEGMDLDTAMHLDKQQTYAEKLKLCAEVHLDLQHFEKALQYGNECLNMRKQLLKPTHPNVTLGYYLLGTVYFRWFIQLKEEKKDPKEATKKLKEAVRVFYRVQDCIEKGGMRIDHPMYGNLKSTHVALFKAKKDKKETQAIERFYLDYEHGQDSTATPSESSDDDSSSSRSSDVDMQGPVDAGKNIDKNEITHADNPLYQSPFVFEKDHLFLQPEISVDSESNICTSDPNKVGVLVQRADSGYESIGLSSQGSSISFQSPVGPNGMLRFDSFEEEVFMATGSAENQGSNTPVGEQKSVSRYTGTRKRPRDPA